MEKNKSKTVTAIVAVMLVIIIGSMLLINKIACLVLVSCLAVYGLGAFAETFCRWLEKEPALLPAEWKPDQEFLDTYDEIKKEAET